MNKNKRKGGAEKLRDKKTRRGSKNV